MNRIEIHHPSYQTFQIIHRQSPIKVAYQNLVCDFNQP